MRLCNIFAPKAKSPSSWSVTAMQTWSEDFCRTTSGSQVRSSTSQRWQSSAHTKSSIGSSTSRQGRTQALKILQIFNKKLIIFTILCSRSRTGIRTSSICCSGSSHASLKAYLEISSTSWSQSLRYSLPLGYRRWLLYNNWRSSRSRRATGTFSSQLKTR